jgi:hypothetical protein
MVISSGDTDGSISAVCRNLDLVDDPNIASGGSGGRPEQLRDSWKSSLLHLSIKEVVFSTGADDGRPSLFESPPDTCLLASSPGESSMLGLPSADATDGWGDISVVGLLLKKLCKVPVLEKARLLFEKVDAG